MAASPTPFLYFPEAGGPACALVQPSTIVREGFLLKRKEEPAGLATRFAFKKRYFRLSGRDLSYSKTPEWQVRLQHAPPPSPHLLPLPIRAAIPNSWLTPSLGPAWPATGVDTRGRGPQSPHQASQTHTQDPSVLMARSSCVSGHSLNSAIICVLCVRDSVLGWMSSGANRHSLRATRTWLVGPAIHQLLWLPGWAHRSSDFGRVVYLQASVSPSSNWRGITDSASEGGRGG